VIAAGVLVDARRAPNSPVTNTARFAQQAALFHIEEHADSRGRASQVRSFSDEKLRSCVSS